jgi:hypothetical protein
MESIIKNGPYSNQASADETQTPEVLRMIQLHQQAVNIFKEDQRNHKQEISSLKKENKDLESNKGKYENEIDRLRKQGDSVTRERDDFKKKYDALRRGLAEAAETIKDKDNEIVFWKNQYNDVFQEKEKLEKKLEEQKQSIREFQDTYYSLPDNSAAVPPQAADTDVRVLNDFNSWAANPAGALPGGFRYLEGDFKIRSTKLIKECASPSKWIINKVGSKKFLFPNPNTFDQMTNINELYLTKEGVLKPQGQNKIQIAKACEISNDGFIEFPGEMRLL